jgi:hypothetical protein
MNFLNEKNEIKLWDRFDEIAKEFGYEISTHNNSTQGRGTYSFKSDKFVPMINIHLWHDSISIFIEDRNGNSILHGETCEICNLKYQEDSFEEITIRFEKMCNYVFNKYKVFSKDNRLDFIFNEMKMERVNF